MNSEQELALRDWLQQTLETLCKLNFLSKDPISDNRRSAVDLILGIGRPDYWGELSNEIINCGHFKSVEGYWGLSEGKDALLECLHAAMELNCYLCQEVDKFGGFDFEILNVKLWGMDEPIADLLLRHLRRLGFTELARDAVIPNRPDLCSSEPDAHRGEVLQKMKNCHRMAYLSFQYAAMKLERIPEGLPDNDAWQYLNEYGIENAGELEGYALPLRDTYTDYLTKARKHLGVSKKRPRETSGRSVVKRSEL